MLTHLLDEQFSIGNKRFGLDPILGLLPGIGDLLPLVLSLYIVWIGTQLKIPEDKVKQMYRNVVVDLVLGAIPVVGDLSDFVYKANSKNMEIIKKYATNIKEGEVI